MTKLFFVQMPYEVPPLVETAGAVVTSVTKTQSQENNV